jgi:hypothetical protein
MECDMVANGYLVTHNQWMGFSGDMKHGEVLNIGPVPYSDIMNITSNNRIKPDRAFLSHFDITNNIGGRGNKNARWDFREDVVKGVNHVAVYHTPPCPWEWDERITREGGPVCEFS